MRSLVLLLAALCSSCLGYVDSPHPRPAPDPQPQPEPAPAPVETCPETVGVARTPLHRANRREYARTLEAVTGFAPTRLPPVDTAEAGFDTVSDGQSVSLAHAESYEQAAWEAATALWYRDFDPGLVKRFELEGQSADGGVEQVRMLCCSPAPQAAPAPARGFYTAYRMSVLTELDLSGDYTVKLGAWGVGAGLTWVVQLDSQNPLARWPVSGTASAPALHSATVHVDHPGVHELEVWLDDPQLVSYAAPAAWGDFLSIERAGAPPPYRYRTCDVRAVGCTVLTLPKILRQVWRRPVHVSDAAPFQVVFNTSRTAGEPVRDAFISAVAAMLLSPELLYRVEADGDPAEGTRPLGAHALAARLSYFLTSAPPDAELFAAADDGSLLEDEVLSQQTARLLAKSDLPDVFGAQLLSTPALEGVQPSAQLFPAFDPALRAAMADEARLFFDAIATEPRHISELVDARFTFVNDALAKHYGLPLPGTTVPSRVSLGTSERGGAISLGSVLAVTSIATRPSEVQRGKWVLGKLTGDAPPPPPFDPGSLPSDGGTARAALEQHASNPACRVCHAKMDPIGIALDRYDADGSYRERDRSGAVIDVRARLPDGTELDGLPGLRALLTKDPEQLERSMVRHLLVYGAARAPAAEDRCAAEVIAGRARTGTFADLVQQVVHSEAFRTRRFEGVTP